MAMIIKVYNTHLLSFAGRGMNLKSWRMSHWYVFMVGVAVVTGTAAAPSSFEGNSEEGEEGVEAEGHERVRRASFNSWAGKRNSIESDTITLDEEGLSRLIQDIADSILAQHNSGFDMTSIRGTRPSLLLASK